MDTQFGGFDVIIVIVYLLFPPELMLMPRRYQLISFWHFASSIEETVIQLALFEDYRLRKATLVFNFDHGFGASD